MSIPVKPPVPITNPAFKYVHSTQTDIRATFARIKAQQAQQLKAWKEVNK